MTNTYTPAPRRMDGPLMASDDARHLPGLSEAAGDAPLNPLDNWRMQWRQSALKRKASEEVQAEGIAIIKSVVMSKLHHDETFMKSQLMVADHERAGELKLKVAKLIEGAIKANSAHLSQFELDLSEDEARRLDAIEESYAAGRLTESRYRQSKANLQARIDKDIESGPADPGKPNRRSRAQCSRARPPLTCWLGRPGRPGSHLLGEEEQCHILS